MSKLQWCLSLFRCHFRNAIRTQLLAVLVCRWMRSNGSITVKCLFICVESHVIPSPGKLGVHSIPRSSRYSTVPTAAAIYAVRLPTNARCCKLIINIYGPHSQPSAPRYLLTTNSVVMHQLLEYTVPAFACVGVYFECDYIRRLTRCRSQRLFHICMCISVCRLYVGPPLPLSFFLSL